LKKLQAHHSVSSLLLVNLLVLMIVGQYDTEGEANTVAAAKVTDPDNFYRTRVHPPNGNGYQDVEQN
jgi:hypothetical protein